MTRAEKILAGRMEALTDLVRALTRRTCPPPSFTHNNCKDTCGDCWLAYLNETEEE